MYVCNIMYVCLSLCVHVCACMFVNLHWLIFITKCVSSCVLFQPQHLKVRSLRSWYVLSCMRISPFYLRTHSRVKDHLERNLLPANHGLLISIYHLRHDNPFHCLFLHCEGRARLYVYVRFLVHGSFVCVNVRLRCTRT